MQLNEGFSLGFGPTNQIKNIFSDCVIHQRLVPHVHTADVYTVKFLTAFFHSWKRTKDGLKSRLEQDCW